MPSTLPGIQAQQLHQVSVEHVPRLDPVDEYGWQGDHLPDTGYGQQGLPLKVHPPTRQSTSSPCPIQSDPDILSSSSSIKWSSMKVGGLSKSRLYVVVLSPSTTQQ